MIHRKIIVPSNNKTEIPLSDIIYTHVYGVFGGMPIIIQFFKETTSHSAYYKFAIPGNPSNSISKEVNTLLTLIHTTPYELIEVAINLLGIEFHQIETN